LPSNEESAAGDTVLKLHNFSPSSLKIHLAHQIAVAQFTWPLRLQTDWSNQTLTGFRRFAGRSFSKRRKSSPELKRKGL
jgi:hypothetical protein